MTAEPAAVTRFKEAHTAAGGGGRIVILPDTVHTAVLAAEALGCEVGAIANSLLFDADGTPVLILTSGSHRVDTAATAAVLPCWLSPSGITTSSTSSPAKRTASQPRSDQEE